ncbi:hypothetical protein HDU86_007055 [Geranomyces michiganensis]|nr:hypothetical protein HDU86_007055 [Geranomyces michiganensis]
MRNPLANLRARMALHSHPPHAPPIIIHLPASTSLAATDDVRRVRWCLSLKDVDWYETTPPPHTLAHLTGNSSKSSLPHADRKTPVLQMGRDFYYGVASAARGIERRCGHPTLYPARSDSGHASGLASTPHGEVDAAILRRWADTNLRPAASELATKTGDTSAAAETGATDRILAHLALIESILRASLPATDGAASLLRSSPPDRRMADATAAAHSPAPTSTPSSSKRWHGLRGTTAPYPHAADIFLASTVLAIRDMRTASTNLRSRLASACPLTLEWCARVHSYLATKDADAEPISISPEDCVSVLRNTYTVGELGNSSRGLHTAPSTPKRQRTVRLASGEVFEGMLVVESEQDVTLEYEVDNVAEDGNDAAVATRARCSVTLPREDIVSISGHAKASFQYVD